MPNSSMSFYPILAPLRSPPSSLLSPPPCPTSPYSITSTSSPSSTYPVPVSPDDKQQQQHVFKAPAGYPSCPSSGPSSTFFAAAESAACMGGGGGGGNSKRPILPKQAIAVMKSWLFQHIVVSKNQPIVFLCL